MRRTARKIFGYTRGVQLRTQAFSRQCAKLPSSAVGIDARRVPRRHGGALVATLAGGVTAGTARKRGRDTSWPCYSPSVA
jgi:hypothetical protein